MYKNSFRYLTGLFLALIMVTAFAQAQGQCCKQGKQGKRGEGKMMMFKELNLSEDQMSKLKKEFESMKAGREERRAEMKSAYDELQKAIDNKAGDAVIKEKTAKLEAVKEKVKNIREKHLETLKSVLTPEQYAKVASMKQNRWDKNPGECLQGKGMQGDCKMGKGKGMNADCPMNKNKTEKK
jgi:Spy/CpxP family protein refolding chaperone